MQDRTIWWMVTGAWLVLAVGALLTVMGVGSGGSTDAIWLFPLVGSGIAVVSLLRLGLGPTVYAAAAALFVTGAAWQVHAGFRVAYRDGDIAKDTLIYNTTSADVIDLATDLEEMSLLMYGDRSLAVMVESCHSIQYPFYWHLRDMPNVRYITAFPDDPSAMPAVVIGSLPFWSEGECAAPVSMPGYITQPIALRWHEPEREIYRNFAIAPELGPGWSAWQYPEQPHGLVDVVTSITDSLRYATTPDGQRRLIDLMLYRQLPDGLNTFYVNVYVRQDIVPWWTDVRYGLNG
jgi:hypothetical protein